MISGAAGLFLILAINLGASAYLALRGASPTFPPEFDQRYLTLIGWGFLVPFVWGFSAKWLQVFLGSQPTRANLLLAAVALNYAGIIVTFAGQGARATILFVLGTALAIAALRVFEPSRQEAKTRGVHASFPFFVRLSYASLLVASLLGVAAGQWDVSGGIWGASRHALTVGFVAVMVFCVGQRILPAFAGMRLLWSTRLMFAGLLLLETGCTLRVSCEVLAYQGYANWAWQVLPPSALLELSGVTAFAMNLFATFLLEPSHIQKQPTHVQAPKPLSSTY